MHLKFSGNNISLKLSEISFNYENIIVETMGPETIFGEMEGIISDSIFGLCTVQCSSVEHGMYTVCVKDLYAVGTHVHTLTRVVPSPSLHQFS